MNNLKVRISMVEHDVKQYQLAQMMGRHEGSVSRMLRDELPDEEQDRIVRLIEEEANNNERKNGSH